jgi:hypothetical protein
MCGWRGVSSILSIGKHDTIFHNNEFVILLLLTPTHFCFLMFRPRVVSVEYNCNFPIASTLAMSPVNDPDAPWGNSWNQFDLFYGASAGSIKMMAEEAGYEVVHFVGIHDMILVRRDLLGGDCPPPYARFSRRVGSLHSCIIDERRRGKWVEYGTIFSRMFRTCAITLVHSCFYFAVLWYKCGD